MVAFSGCVGTDIRPAAKALPEIKAIYDEYPTAHMVALFMKEDVVKLVIKDITKTCGKEMPLQDYWYITVKVDKKVTEFYVDKEATKVMCIIEPEEDPDDVEHGCNNAEECNDGNLATKDTCEGWPRTCLNAPITECRNGDLYCPQNCSYNNDEDCPAIDQCLSNLDCADSNNFTKDECIGEPRYCKHTLKTCKELNENTCEEYEECPGKILPTTDKKICCNIPCSKTKSCEGIKCLSHQKCINGECYNKSCEERNLPLCTLNEECTGDYYKDDSAITCCDKECRKPCEEDIDCSSEEMCDGEYCIVKACEDIGGKTCDKDTEKCIGEIERTLDNDNCCTECELIKCEEMDGIICDSAEGEECTGKTKNAFDTAECCMKECEIDWCFDKPCAINKNCEEQKCVFKTCEELEGNACEIETKTCAGDSYRTSDTPYCCVGTCNLN